MGNACGCADDVDPALHLSSIKQADISDKQFKIAAFDTKSTISEFAKLSNEQKDQTLAEVIRLISEHGDLASINISNASLKEHFLKDKANITLKTHDNKQEVFEGEVINGLANGTGKIKLSDGTIYEGRFATGYKIGGGIIKSESQGVIHINYGEKGIAEGITTLKLKNGSTYTYFHSKDIKEGPILGTHPTSIEFARLVSSKKNGLSVRISKDYQMLTLDEFKDDNAIGDTKIFTKADKPVAPAPTPVKPAQESLPKTPEGQTAPQPQPGAPAPAQQAALPSAPQGQNPAAK
jgi:hypothetical protein